MQSISDVVRQIFLTHFGEPACIVRSPGRINLIGEHTDYNLGFVLPAAIDKAIYVAIGKRADTSIKLLAGDLNESFASSLQDLQPSPLQWPNYILGVADELIKAGHTLSGFNLVVMGDVPLGAGLSSSAAVECAPAFALNQLFGLALQKIDLVKLSQRAENEFVGVKCGIMDQFASMFGKRGQVIQLDCRSLEAVYLPFPMDGIRIVLFDTNVKHSLASSAYNERREECEAGVTYLKQLYPFVTSLRDVTPTMVEKGLTGKPGKIYERCKYIVQEIDRLQRAGVQLVKGELIAFGQCMYETHDGLRDLYEVSCPELDVLVNLVRDEEAVYGARMMGGGFGGCTINIVKEEGAEALLKKVTTAYAAQFGQPPGVYQVSIEDGTALV